MVHHSFYCSLGLSLTDQGHRPSAAASPRGSPDAVNVRVRRPRHLEVDHGVHTLAVRNGTGKKTVEGVLGKIRDMLVAFF